MNDNIKIIPGVTYLTEFGVSVTALREVSPYRAIFVSEEFCPTPFVAYLYTIIDTNRIVLDCGNYYATYEEAVQAECDESQFVWLDVNLYCPDCDTFHKHSYMLNKPVQDFVEEIEDHRYVCEECGDTFMGISSLSMRDKDTVYDLPLWRGPLPEVY